MKSAVTAVVWASVGLGPGLGAAAASEPAHIENRCPRLSGSDYEEIDARVQLLLRSETEPRPLPAVVCEGKEGWVEWEGRRFPILGRAPIAEEVVDIVEGVLHDAEREADADPRTTEAAAVAAGEPMLERGAGAAPVLPANAQRADPVASRASDARGGGIALAIQTELPSSTIGVAFGPSFDFGANVGPLIIGGHEAFRVAPAGRSVMFMDFAAMVGVGAPLNPDARFGFVTRFGAEWMIAYPEGNSGQAAVVPVWGVGLRVAHTFPVVGIWLGIDGHYRLSRLTLRSSKSLSANDLGGSLSLGVAFVDWSRK
ncbi:MAG TPA: hypothetical protein VEX18_15545 [Polyangiaceae bacterium]|nr:hypothetical protein [Polyangiaceae bacterium]